MALIRISRKKNVFASLNGKEIAVIPASTLQTFDKTPLDLRNRDVVTVTGDRVSSFTVSINKPATTQPTTQPAEMHEFTIERHKAEAPVLGPALPGDLKIPATQPSAIPATQPPSRQRSRRPSRPLPRRNPPMRGSTTQPSTPTTQPAVATTQPTTQAAEIAAAKWIFPFGGTGAADEGQVTDLLADLHPLRAEKYLDSEKVPGETYTLTLHVIPATAADTAEDIVLTFIDTGGRVDGFYKDLHFTVNRSLIDKLTGDFKTKAAPPAMSPPSFPGGGRVAVRRRSSLQTCDVRGFWLPLPCTQGREGEGRFGEMRRPTKTSPHPSPLP